MILTVLIAAVVTLALTPVARQLLLRFDLVDIPNSRSSHTSTTARGGGISVMVGTTLGVVVAADGVDRIVVALIGGAVALGVVGFVDDRRGLGAVVRLLAQIVIPAVAVGLLFDGSTRSGFGLPVLIVLAVAWTVGYVNAFNFMDGINGLSVMQTLVAGATFAILGESHDVRLLTIGGLAIAAAAFGFAPYNAWRPSVFLGDVGSYFIGTWLASLLVIAVAQGVHPLVAIGPFLLYLADTSTTMIRRGLRGENILSAHREHAYQRLAQCGWSHLRVTLSAGLAIGVTSTLMLLANDRSPLAFVGFFAASLLVVLAFILLPNALERMRPVTPS